MLHDISSKLKEKSSIVVSHGYCVGKENLCPKVVISTNARAVKVKKIRSFSRGLSTIGIMPKRSRFLRDYMRGSDYLDMLRDWQCVGHDIQTSVEIVKVKYGKEEIARESPCR